MGWDDSYQTTITLPSGATTGQRIVLDSTTDEISVYNAANVRVILISPTGIQLFDPTTGQLSAEGSLSAGADSEPGWVAYNADFENPAYAALTNSDLEFGTPGVSYFDYPRIQVFQNSGTADPFSMIITCGALNGTGVGIPYLKLFASTTGHGLVEIDFDGDQGPTDFQISGNLRAGSRAFGSVNITPVANTPTSFVLSNIGLTGTVAKGFATADTSVPGTQVTGVGITGPTPNGMTIWLTRTNTTTTTVEWLMESQ